MTLEILKADVDTAAGEVDAVGDGVAGAKPGAHLSGVGTALPGSQSAGAARALATAWDGSVSDLARDAHTLAAQMRAAADHLQATDEVVGHAFRGPVARAQ